MNKLILLFTTIFFFLSLTSATSIYDNCQIYGNCQPIQTIISFDNNTGSTNNSIYWDGHAFVFGSIASIESDPFYFSNPNNYINSTTLKEQDPNYFSNPNNYLNQTITDGIYVPYIGATKDLNLDGHNLNATNITGENLVLNKNLSAFNGTFIGKVNMRYLNVTDGVGLSIFNNDIQDLIINTSGQIWITFPFSDSRITIIPSSESIEANILYITNIAPRTTLGGLRIGGLASNYIGFFDATPIQKPSSTTDIKDALINLGLITGGGATNLNLDGGNLTANYFIGNGSLLTDVCLTNGSNCKSSPSIWLNTSDTLYINSSYPQNINVSNATLENVQSKNSVATGLYSSSLGYKTNSSNTGSFAGGYAFNENNVGANIISSGLGSFAGGYSHDANIDDTLYTANIISNGTGSFAWGFVDAVPNEADSFLISSGQGSFASGVNSISSGQGSVAMGTFVTSSGTGSFATGFSNIASNTGAFASGLQSQATGYGSFASGFQTVASGQFSTIFGNALTNNIDNSFEVGFGTLGLIVRQNNVTIPTNLNQINGNATINNIYGEMWFHNDTTGNVTNIASANVWYNVSALGGQQQVGSQLNGFSYTGGATGTLRNQISGLYQASYCTSISGGINDKYHLALYVNGTQQFNTEEHFKTGTSGDVFDICGNGFLRLNANSQINLQVMDETSSASVTIYSVDVNLVRIGN